MRRSLALRARSGDLPLPLMGRCLFVAEGEEGQHLVRKLLPQGVVVEAGLCLGVRRLGQPRSTSRYIDFLLTFARRAASAGVSMGRTSSGVIVWVLMP